MRFQLITSLVALSSVYAATVRLAGDSTMAATGANDGFTAGWGAHIGKYLNIAIDNAAIGGRSSRSYTREGRFTALANKVVSGDYVIIEFGHNDGGSLSTDNGRSVCSVGTAGYATTCQTTYNGVSETVQTYYTYLVAAAKLFKSKGANVIISSPTPNNVCETGTCSYTAGRFTGYARDAASATGSAFVDHGQTTANLYIQRGRDVTNSYYPKDHTHTSPAGADAVAQAFITGLRSSNSTLKNLIK
ncbi:SGNH hydrolase-type esterase domain-containing protein [Pterulicium gracile]|uniref:SGNH hydrolase-type esterase domain-containing protein n=1 Tax=Pterulicium gracile TaxID=1884261 RepID=A0A5C3QSJ7_9AGAR|nr:SGNH hydrolase-type esterase domain-containing protein [Pterula gracilis]